MKTFVYVLLGVFLASTTVSHAAVTGDTCKKLAETVASGFAESFSSMDFDAARYYAACEADQSASGVGLNLAYAGFGLGVQYNNESKKAFCAKSLGDYHIDKLSYVKTKVVFNQALATIDKCISAAAKGWDVVYERVGKDAISLTLSNGSDLGARLLGVDVIPANTLTCTPSLPTSAVVVTNAISYTCVRQPISQVVDGISVVSAPEASLILRLSDGPLPITLPAYSSSAIEQLRADIQRARQEAAASVGILRKELLAGSNSAQYANECPAGQYVTKLVWSAGAGGGGGSITNIAVFCRALVAPAP